MTLQRPSRQAWYRRLVPVEPPEPAAPRPVAGPDAARARFAELSAPDADYPEATRSRLFEPDGGSPATLLLWHGFTNAPSQFAAVGEELCGRGYRVVLPRMPWHGSADLLNRDLGRLTTRQLVEHAGAWADLAAGFGAPVWAFGLSAGAAVAGWVAATRPEVTRLVLAAPVAAPKAVPLPLVRLFARRPGLAPRFYYWWDPRVKENLGHSPHAYPGFPVPGLVPYLQLTEALTDGAVHAGHELERVVLLRNPGDFAIRHDAARAFAGAAFGASARVSAEVVMDGDLKWMHDFVDPWSPGAGTAAQVADILLACFGVGEPSAGGLLVPPLPEPQPA